MLKKTCKLLRKAGVDLNEVQYDYGINSHLFIELG